MNKPVRLLIAEDHPLIRAGLQHIVGLTKAFTLMAYATTLLQAYKLCQQNQPDILLISLSLFPIPAKPTLDQLREEYPQIRLLLLGEECDSDCLTNLLNAGVAGFVRKNDPIENIISAIHIVAKGGDYFNQARSVSLVSSPSHYAESFMPEFNSLTKRETEIMNLLIKGLDNRMIASELGLSYQTVRNRLCIIYEKLGVQSRAEAIVYVTQPDRARWKN